MRHASLSQESGTYPFGLQTAFYSDIYLPLVTVDTPIASSRGNAMPQKN